LNIILGVYRIESMKESKCINGDRVDLELCGSPEEALYGSDALVMCTECKNFRIHDTEFLSKSLNFPVLVDGINLYKT